MKVSRLRTIFIVQCYIFSDNGYDQKAIINQSGCWTKIYFLGYLDFSVCLLGVIQKSKRDKARAKHIEIHKHYTLHNLKDDQIN